jgi:hypothetical protein
MNIKQKIRPITASTLLVASMSMVLVSTSPSTVSADPASTQVTCKDGKKKTANKTDKADKTILDKKDFQFACRNNDGYAAPEPKDEGGDESGGEDTGDDGSFTGTNQVEGDDCGGVETAFIKCDAGNSGTTEDNGIWALLLIAVNILTAGVGILAVGGIVYGSILYTTAEDKADQVKKATDIITNVVIGLVMFGLMWAGLNFIVPGGVFQ